MAIDDIYRVTANFTGYNAQLINWVWHYKQVDVGSPPVNTILSNIVTALTTNWDDIKSFLVPEVDGDTCDLALWDAALNRFDTIATQDISALTGTAAADGLPLNSSPYVTFFTDIGRSRGKKKIFGVAETAVTRGALDVGILAALALFAAGFDDDVSAAGVIYRPGNFNRVTETFIEWDQATVGVGAFAGSQYSRLPGRGA